MIRLRSAHLTVPFILLAAGCGGGTEPKGGTEPTAKRRVSLTASVLHGSTPGVSSFITAASSRSFVTSSAVASPGLWAISPDQARLTILSVSFIAADGNARSATLTNCVVNYTRSTASLTKLLDCPFTVDSGTYVAVDVQFANSFDVLIDDQVNGIYTDAASPTKLSATRPAAGPQMVNYSLTLNPGSKGVFASVTYFPTAVKIDSGSVMPTVSLVADLIHTVFVTVNSSSMNFFIDVPNPAVQIIPSINGAGRVEFYTPTGTALSARMGGDSDTESHSVRVFYASPPQPAYIFSPVVGPSSAQSVDPAKSPVRGDLGFRAGGYAGLDASGTLCWALPKTFAYQSYAYLLRMRSVNTLGATTTVQRFWFGTNGGQATPPASGDTYASGCPSFTPTEQFNVVLVAK